MKAWLALIVALLFYGTLQVRNFVPASAEPDTDGYIILAKRIATGAPLAQRDADIFEHANHVWVENARGEVIPKYAPGYPALLAVAYRLGGDTAMYWVAPVLGGLALIGAWLWFRCWLSELACSFAILTLAGNRMFLDYASYPLSHVAELCFAVWGLYFLGRPRTTDALAAGLLLGFACTVRHTAVLLLLPVLVTRPSWKTLATFAVGPAILAAYNWSIFGAPWRTGYALSDEQGAFGIGSFWSNTRMLATGLNGEYLVFLFPLALLGMTLFGKPRERWLRLSCFVPVVVLHALYYWSQPTLAYYRFLYATLPVLIGCVFLCLDRLPHRSVVMAVACVAAVAHDWTGYRGVLLNSNGRRLVSASEIAAEILPDRATIFAAPPLDTSVGTRKDFRQYSLAAFDRPPRQAALDPRMQPARLARLRDALRETGPEATLARQREAIRNAPSPVVVVPVGMIRGLLGDGLEATLLREFTVDNHQRRWGFYAVRPVSGR